MRAVVLPRLTGGTARRGGQAEIRVDPQPDTAPTLQRADEGALPLLGSAPSVWRGESSGSRPTVFYVGDTDMGRSAGRAVSPSAPSKGR